MATERYQIPPQKGVLTGTDGNDQFVGSSEIHVAQIDDGLRNTIVTSNGALQSTVGAAGTDRYQGIDTLLFVDGRLTFNADDDAAAVTRLYQVALGREVDQLGLNYSIGELEKDANAEDIAAGLITSAEFNQNFGALDNTQFVQHLYTNMRGSEATSGEVSQWVSLLNDGLSRADVVVDFAQSAEMRNATADIVGAGIWDRDEDAIAAARVYDIVLNRDADLDGMTYWVSRLHDDMDPEDLAGAFLDSNEGVNAYGALSNTDFVNAIYNNALERDAEAAGSTFWVRELDNGMDRSELVIAISTSTEYLNLTNPIFASEDPAQFGIPMGGDTLIA